MTTTTTAKMAHNNSISVDRDALREQQRQARQALKNESKDSPSNTANLFAEPFKVSNASDDPLRKQIQRTLGEYDDIRHTISSNPKNLIGIASQPQTPLLGTFSYDTILQQAPLFPDVLKPPKPPYVNGQIKPSSGSGGGGGHHPHHHNHHHRQGSSNSSSGGSSSSSRLHNGSVSSAAVTADVAPRSGNNGWNNNVISQVKQPVENYGLAKQKVGFKSHSPVPQSQFLGNHSLSSAAAHPVVQESYKQELTVSGTGARDQCSPLRHGDKTKGFTQISQQTHHHPSSSSANALSLSTPSSKSNTGDHSRMNGVIVNGSVKPGYGRTGMAKPNLRLNIEEAAKPNQDLADVENILKEMIAPTPVTGIPTPRKDETKFAFSAVANHQLTAPHSGEHHSSKSVSRSLDKSFAALSAPSATDRSSTVASTKPRSGEILVRDLEISEDSSDEDVGPPGRKLVSEPRNAVRSPGHSVLTNPPPPVTAMSPDNDESSSSSSEYSSSDSESEDSVNKPLSDHDDPKPMSPKQPHMDWDLVNFIPTQPEAPFGLPSDTPLPFSQEKSTVNRHPNNSSGNSTNKTNVCDPGSRRSAGRAADQTLHNDDNVGDDDFCLVPDILSNDYVQDDIKTLTSPPRDSLSGLGCYHRTNVPFNNVMEDVRPVSPPLSPPSPPPSQIPPKRPPTSSQSSKSKKKLSVSPRSRSPAAATLSATSTSSSSQSRESKSLVSREFNEKSGGKRALLPDPVKEGMVEKERLKSSLNSKGQAYREKHHRPETNFDSELMTKDKFGYGPGKESANDSKEENALKKFSASVSKRPRTPPGPPPPSPPPVILPPPVTASGKSLVRQNSGGSVKDAVTPLSSSSRSSKPTGAQKPNSSSSTSSKAQSKSERKEAAATKHKKSPHGKRSSKSSNKIKSKELISDASDSDTDADIDVGVGSSPAQPPPVLLKTPTRVASERSNESGLARRPYSSSSTSLSSVADSIEDVSANSAVLAKSKSSGSRNSNQNSSNSSSASRKAKAVMQTATSSSKSSSLVSREKSKPLKPSSNSKSGNAVSLVEEMSLRMAPLSPLCKDDFKEQRSHVKVKESHLQSVKIPPLVFHGGFPSIMVNLDRSLLERLPAFPPVQLRLTPDSHSTSSATKKEQSAGKKLKSDNKTVKSETKLKQGTNHEIVSGKENSQMGLNDNNNNNNNKSDVKSSNKRPLQDPDVWPSEGKKLKLSSKEKDASSESLAHTSLKVKANDTSMENIKIKKEEFLSEDSSFKSSIVKSSPATTHVSRSPVDFLEKKSKSSSSSSHKNSPSKRDKKRSASSLSSTAVKKEKLSRESAGVTIKVEGDGDLDRSKKSGHKSVIGAEAKKEVQVDTAAAVPTASSGLTVQIFPKEGKQRAGRDNSDAADVKKWKGSSANASSASQATSVSSSYTDTQKAITLEGIERNTNHDRIPSSNDFSTSKSATSSSTLASSRDSVLDRINEIVDMRTRSSDDFYVSHAKYLKHEADKETDRTTQALKYLHAVLYFTLHGMSMEYDRTNPNTISIMFSHTLDLIRFVCSKFRCNQSTNANTVVENKLAVLCLRCQSIVNLKLFHMKKPEVRDFQKTLAEYQKTPLHRTGTKQMTSPGQSSSTNAVPATLWNNKTNGAPSPMSPLPSPAGSVGSVESQSSGYSSSEIGQQQQCRSNNSGNGGSHSGGGSSANSMAALTNPSAAATHSSSLPTISIPVHIHSTMQKQLANINYLIMAHENWEQAESLILRGGNQDFFTELDERCGKLQLLSSLRDMVRYVMLGIYCLDKSVLR